MTIDKVTRALFQAIGKSDKPAAREALAKGAQVNARDSQGDTPLHLAAAMNHMDLVKLLIDCGADVNATEEFYYTPLHIAALCGQTGIAKLLIDRGANVNAKDGSDFTALHLAAEAGQTDMVRVLVKRGANPTGKSRYGETPLHVLPCGHAAIVDILQKARNKAHVAHITKRREQGGDRDRGE